VIYMVVESASNLQSMGAEWGKRVSLGATARWPQVSSPNVLLGAWTKKSPTLVAVPVVVGDGDVAHVVDLLAWVILVDIGGLAVDGAFEVVAAVLYAPEPMSMVSS
jgi:hypothetical protein